MLFPHQLTEAPERLLLVDDLGEVGEGPPVEGPGVHVDVYPHFSSTLAPQRRTARMTSWRVGMSS